MKMQAGSNGCSRRASESHATANVSLLAEVTNSSFNNGEMTIAWQLPACWYISRKIILFLVAFTCCQLWHWALKPLWGTFILCLLCVWTKAVLLIVVQILSSSSICFRREWKKLGNCTIPVWPLSHNNWHYLRKNILMLPKIDNKKKNSGLIMFVNNKSSFLVRVP